MADTDLTTMRCIMSLAEAQSLLEAIVHQDDRLEESTVDFVRSLYRVTAPGASDRVRLEVTSEQLAIVRGYESLTPSAG